MIMTGSKSKSAIIVFWMGLCSICYGALLGGNSTLFASTVEKEFASQNKAAILEKNIREAPIGLQRLLKAYPEHLVGITNNGLIWKDKSVMPYDDGAGDKDFETRLKHPDLEDQMSIPYPVGQRHENPAPVDFDPGRIRYMPFFLKMYGKDVNEVGKHLVKIIWLRHSENRLLMVTSVNGVDKKLQAVSDELDALPDDLKKYVSNPAGTFHWRKIMHTDRLSMHSFGIAIDINSKSAKYWEWDKHKSDNRKNQIPIQIIEIFERHGFIWGGKWYHYDTMHFEFRPEFFIND